MTKQTALSISHGYIVIPPQPSDAYPIPCTDWNYLKDKVRGISTEVVMFHTLGSVLFGAGVSTLVSILLGNFPNTSPGVPSTTQIIAWAVVAVTIICGILCWIFSDRERKQQKTRARDVVAQMDVIEARYKSVP
jgi:hypothetical protein